MTPQAFIEMTESGAVTPSFYISGYYPPREVNPAERGDEPMWLVHFPRGFETLDVAVLGHGLCDADAMDAAVEFLRDHHPEALTQGERDSLDSDEATDGITVTPPRGGNRPRLWDPSKAQTDANDAEMRANGSFQ